MIFMIIIPVFMVILLGYCFGKKVPIEKNSDKLINDYALYIALPALLFLAIAQANVDELKQWGFIASSLGGIFIVYIIAGLMARLIGIRLPHSSILSMGASYGTTGFMGIPILISVYGSKAALPAAIATILHNIPVIVAVIISWEFFGSKSKGYGFSVLYNLWKILKTIFTNPLTLAVLVGLIFVLFDIKIPAFLEYFAKFLAGAAGPTALFALGLGLSRLKIKEHANSNTLKMVIPMVFLKVVVQPIITFLIAVYIFGMGDNNSLWLATAVVMAAQPISASVYVFAQQYEYKKEIISLAIIISLLITIITLPIFLSMFQV